MQIKYTTEISECVSKDSQSTAWFSEKTKQNKQTLYKQQNPKNQKNSDVGKPRQTPTQRVHISLGVLPPPQNPLPGLIPTLLTFGGSCLIYITSLNLIP